MAGIGFELKKLFQKKGLFATFRAYGYTGIICTGPMLLGILLLLGVMYLCSRMGITNQNRELLVCMITYTLLASLLVTSFFSMVITRFLADMLYEEKKETILSSFWGAVGIMLVIGEVLYGIFLLCSGIDWLNQIILLWLFGILIVVWNAMSYLTAIKNYMGILKSFIAAVVVTFLTGWLLLVIVGPQVEALLIAVCCGYAVMMIWDVILLYQYFPQSNSSPYLFLEWFDRYWPLALVGLFTNVGLYAHLVIMWAGPIGKQVKGLFYGAPYHDIPALIAFLTTLITTVNFVVSVEVNFYPSYKNYYILFNDKGSIKDIKQAEKEMLKVLDSEIKYTSLKQLFVTVIAISVAGSLLDLLPLGFNDLMHGYFRTLCVGYGIYSLANTMMLLLLYFTDYKGALAAAGVFAFVTAALTAISLLGPKVYYGFGFLLGSTAFYLVAYYRMNVFTKRLPYHILSTQPIVAEKKSGLFTKAQKFLEEILHEN